MAVVSPRERAERSADYHWAGSVRFIESDSPPMRPGRGRERSPAKGGRHAGSPPFDAVLGEVCEGLHGGSLDSAAARTQVREAGFDEFIRAAGSREEVDALGHFCDAGLDFWRHDTNPGGIRRAMFMQRGRFT